MNDWFGLAVAVAALVCAVAALLVQRRNLAALHRVRATSRLIRYGVAQDLDHAGRADAATAARCAADAIDAALNGRHR